MRRGIRGEGLGRKGGPLPRYQYDCERCKLSWNCGPSSGCDVNVPMSETPQERMEDVYRAFEDCGLPNSAIAIRKIYEELTREQG